MCTAVLSAAVKLRFDYLRIPFGTAANIDKADGLIPRAARWTRNAGSGNTNVSLCKRARTPRHLLCGLFRNGAMGSKRFARYMKQLFLYMV